MGSYIFTPTSNTAGLPFEDNWSTMFRKSWNPLSHCSSSRVQVSQQASSQPLEVGRDRCWTEESGDNSLCLGASRCVSVHGTERCEREPAAAGWSGPSSCCPGSPTTRQHSNSNFIPRCSILTVAFKSTEI